MNVLNKFAETFTVMELHMFIHEPFDVWGGGRGLRCMEGVNNNV